MKSTTPTGIIPNGAELEGAGGKGSRQATRTPDNLLSQDYVELLLGFGEGPIGGVQGDEDKRALRNVYLGETPLENADGKANFNDFKATLFYGRDNDPPVERVLGGDAANLSVGTPLSKDIAVIRTTPALYRKTEEGTGIMRLEIRIMFQQLFKTNDSGDYEHTALFQISYKPSNTTTWVHYQGQEELSITGKTTSGYVKDFLIDVTPLADADYDIRVTKRSPDNGTQEIVELVWESIQMVTMARPKFPGLAMLHLWGRVSDQFSSLPDISAVLHGIELEVPTNYNPVTRTYDESSPWNGTTKKAFTNNPAWVLYYLLTSPVHGLARYYKNVSVNRYEFYNAAKWCDEQVPAQATGQTQPRFTFNEVLNTRKLGFETLLYVAGSFNSTLLDRGDGVIRLRTDQYRTPKMIFSPENVVNGEFNYSVADITTRVNEVTVRFVNPDLGWIDDQRSASIDASEWQAKNGIIPYDFQAVGCTDAHEAIRRANDRLLTANTEVTSVSFETSRLGVFLEPFDIVYIADPVSGWSTGGRIKSVAGAVIHLRDPIYFATTAPVTMRLMTVEGIVTLTVQPAVTGAVYSLTITSGTITGTLPDRAVFTLEDTNDFGIAKPFRVMEIDSLEGDGNHFRISAVEVNVNKYGDSASGTLSDPVEYDFTTPGEPKLPSVLVISNAPPLISADGSLTYRLRASWDMPFQAFTSHYELEYSEVDSGVWTTLIVYGEEAYVQPLRSGARYNFRLFAISPLGKRSRRSVQANNILVATKAAVLQNVIGLAVVNNNIGWEVSWQPPTEIPDYDGVELRVGTTSHTWGTLSTAYRTYGNSHVLPWLTAGINRIFAKYVDTTGNESAVAQSFDLAISNPSAPVIGAVRNVAGTIEIDFSDCTTSQPLKLIHIRIGDTWDSATQVSTVAGNQRTISLVFEDSGRKTIFLRAEDAAGNLGVEGYTIFDLDIRGSLLNQIGDLPEAEVAFGAITSDHLYHELGERINLIDAEGTGLVQQVENLITTYGSTVDAAESAAAAVQAQTEADLARIAAEAAAAAAGDAEVAAVQAKADAILAEGAAETAAAVAGEARTEAVQARADAITAQNAAQTSAVVADQAKVDAVQAFNNAVLESGEAAAHSEAAGSHKVQAQEAKEIAVSAASQAGQYSTEAQIASEDAVASAVSAAGSASSASSSKTVATSAANQAETSATNAHISYQDTVRSATSAAGSASFAESQKELATAARDAASGHATTASNKATEAASSAVSAESARSSAETERNLATTARNEASGFATTAGTKATESATSAANAAGSASAAENSRLLAVSAANEATSSAATAAIAATDAVEAAITADASASAATSAKSLAVSSANAAGTAASDAKITYKDTVKSATDAASSASTAASERTLATTARNEASGFATTAGNKATEAAASAVDASGSASTATTARELAVAAQNTAQGHAATATTKASEAATSASNASGSAASAETSRLLAVEASSSASQSAATASIAATDAVEAAITANASSSAASSAKTIAVSSANAAGSSAADASIKARDSAKSATTAAGSAATATTERELATAARDAASGHATTASNKAGEATTSASNAAGSASAAESSRVLATTAASNASASATTATNKATESASSASNAAGSASQAESSRLLAAEAASTATTQATSASIAATDAVNAAISATASASAATSSKTLAVSAANEAGSHSAAASIKYKDTVKSAADAATSASQASSSKDLAAGSATTAGNHANAALGYSQTASTRATEAATSASASETARLAAEARRNEAEGFANSANTHAGTASAQATAAGNSANASQTARLAAEAARDNASGSASAASSSASAASASATTAGQHATSASTHANNASTSAGSAQTYAGQAATSASNAGTAASSAASALSLIRAISVTEFRAKETWEFKNGYDGWSSSSGSITLQPNSIILYHTAYDCFLFRTLPAFSGAEFDKIRIRFRFYSGTNINWEGTLYYQTSGHTWDGSYNKTIAKPEKLLTSGGDWVVAEWDMELLTNGGLDWKNSQIIGLRFDLDSGVGANYEIDWISIGRHSTATSEAEIFTLQQAMQQADTANASSITALTSTVNGNTSAIASEISTRSSITDGLRAQYTIKADLNGYVSGFGLASEAPVNGNPSSSFIVRADKFAVASPTGPGIPAVVPFAVISGHSVIPTGVYMSGAYIDGREIRIRDADGNIIFSSGTPLSSKRLVDSAGRTLNDSRLLGNLVDATVWNYGTLGSQQGFGENPTSANGYNYIVHQLLPDGSPGIVWLARSGAAAGTSPEGGWNGTVFNIDRTKMYRFSVWIKAGGAPAALSGSAYLGCTGSVRTVAGGADGNPYFAVFSRAAMPRDKWVLFVGYVYPDSYEGPQEGKGGVYHGETAVKILGGTDFRWGTDATQSSLRTYQYYTGAESNYQWFWDPRVDLINGSEPSLETLLSFGKVKEAAKTANWGAIASRPAENLLLNSAITIDSNGKIQGIDPTQGAGLSVANNQNSVIRDPIGGTFVTSTDLFYGPIKITLPVSWSNTMMKFIVDIYEYNGGYSCTLEIAGYNYGAGAWYNTTARCIGNSNVEYPVRFGHDGTRCCVWIGGDSESWLYPQIRVKDVFVGYSNYSRATWESGWSVGFGGVANITPGDAGTILDTLPGADWKKSSQRPANLAGLSGTETIKNNQLSIISGTLQGIGDGNGTAVSNNLIQIDANGAIRNIGTGDGLPVSNNALAFGNNLLYNADFSLGRLLGWSGAMPFFGVPAPAVDAINGAGSPWQINNGVGDSTDQIVVRQMAPVPNASAFYEITSDLIAFEGSARLIASVYTGAHRCRVLIGVYCYNAASEYIAPIEASPGGVSVNEAEASGGAAISGYKRIYAYGTTPAGTTQVRIFMRKHDTYAGQTDSYAFFTRAMLERAAPSAVTPGLWMPGNNAITSRRKITASTASTWIADAAIGSAQVGELTANNIQAGTITVDRLNVTTRTANLTSFNEWSTYATSAAGSFISPILETLGLTATGGFLRLTGYLLISITAPSNVARMGVTVYVTPQLSTGRKFRRTLFVEPYVPYATAGTLYSFNDAIPIDHSINYASGGYSFPIRIEITSAQDSAGNYVNCGPGEIGVEFQLTLQEIKV